MRENEPQTLCFGVNVIVQVHKNMSEQPVQVWGFSFWYLTSTSVQVCRTSAVILGSEMK